MNAGPVLLFFVLPLGLTAALSRLLLHPVFPLLPYLALWWLKPFFSRFILHITGIRFFEPHAKTGRLLRGLPRSLIQGIGGDLLWRRFSPWRGADAPIRVLEKLKGDRIQGRKKALKAGGSGFCVFITLFCLCLEAILLGGEVFCAVILLNVFRPDYIALMLKEDFIIFILLFFEPFVFWAYCCNYAAVESLYGCMGFGLYINSRIEVEGWDLELLFRNRAG
jgi:hypothetical protein